MAQTTQYQAVLDNKVPLKIDIHLENFGWLGAYSGSVNFFDEDLKICGSVGGSLRMEAFKISIDRSCGLTTSQLNLKYKCLLETSASALSNVKYDGIHDRNGNYEWTGWVLAGSTCGSTGGGRRIIDIHIKLTGSQSKNFTMLYRSHQAGSGDTNWAKATYVASTIGTNTYWSNGVKTPFNTDDDYGYDAPDINKRLESIWVYCYPKSLEV